MLRNHLKIAYRSILKYKNYSFINIIGLTLGITAAIFIWQYVALEKSYDQFHSKADRIYRLPIKSYRLGEMEIADAMNYAPTGPALKAEFPEVEEFVRISPEYGRVVLMHKEKKFEEQKIFYADSTLFEVFDFPLLDGDKKTCLTKPGSIVLSRSLAERYFGAWEDWIESPVGKMIRWNNTRQLTITGITEDVPENSHIKFNALLPFTSFIEFNNDPSNNWGWNDFYTYVQLQEGVSQQTFAAKLPNFIARHKDFKVEGTYDEFLVQPLTDIHLNSKLAYEAEPNGDAKTVNFLSLIAFAILFIAWVNYINLATARAEERAQEVGVRKVIGATKESLVFQFLSEAFLLNLSAVIIAIGLIQLFGPLMNAFIGKELPFSFSNLPFGIAILPLFIILGTLISGLYPAFVLSGFSPIQTLKGSEAKRKRGVWLRKGLVTFQYAVSVVLITGTFVVFQQLKFMQKQDLGFSLDQTLVLNAPSVIDNDSILVERYSSFKSELAKYPMIKNVTSASAIPGKAHLDLDTNGPLFLVGTAKEKGATFSVLRADEHFLETFDIKVIAGRNFSPGRKIDQNALVINETALKVLGLTDPKAVIGKKLEYYNRQPTIVGVVEDYHHKSLRNRIEPMIIRNNVGGHLYFAVKFSAKKKSETEQLISNIQSVWKQVYPENPFNFFFLDDHYNEQYNADHQLGRIISLFSLLTIFIACLGLFGLASYTVTVRTKEIGIRKVLGAPISSIILLLTKGYLPLLFLAFILGVPISYYLFSQWLTNFAFAITLNPLIFLLPCVLVLLIALLAVSSQSLQAAVGNPVEALRKE